MRQHPRGGSIALDQRLHRAAAGLGAEQACLDDARVVEDQQVAGLSSAGSSRKTRSTGHGAGRRAAARRSARRRVLAISSAGSSKSKSASVGAIGGHEGLTGWAKRQRLAAGGQAGGGGRSERSQASAERALTATTTPRTRAMRATRRHGAVRRAAKRQGAMLPPWRPTRRWSGLSECVPVAGAAARGGRMSRRQRRESASMVEAPPSKRTSRSPARSARWKVGLARHRPRAAPAAALRGRDAPHPIAGWAGDRRAGWRRGHRQPIVSHRPRRQLVVIAAR